MGGFETPGEVREPGPQQSSWQMVTFAKGRRYEVAQSVVKMGEEFCAPHPHLLFNPGSS